MSLFFLPAARHRRTRARQIQAKQVHHCCAHFSAWAPTLDGGMLLSGLVSLSRKLHGGRNGPASGLLVALESVRLVLQ
jgi:hypothetical protein